VNEEVGSVKTDSKGNNCPFCIENGMVKIIKRTDIAYLVQAIIDGVPAAGRYLIVPIDHMVSLFDRPNDWTRSENDLLGYAIAAAYDDVGLPAHMKGRDLNQALNTSWNQGIPDAGQRVEHMHMWVIFRYDDLAIGMDALIRRLEEQMAISVRRWEILQALGTTH